jgi:hypothetical protein
LTYRVRLATGRNQSHIELTNKSRPLASVCIYL